MPGPRIIVAAKGVALATAEQVATVGVTVAGRVVALGKAVRAAVRAAVGQTVGLEASVVTAGKESRVERPCNPLHGAGANPRRYRTT